MQYWPYEELKISRDSSTNQFVFTTPWATVAIPTDEKAGKRIEDVLELLRSPVLDEDKIQRVTAVLAPIAPYPMAYILPRAIWPTELAQTTRTPDELPLGSPGDLLTYLDSQSDFEEDFHKVLQRSALSSDWGWDSESMLRMAHIPDGDTYDPATLYTVIRRFHLLDSLEGNKTLELYDTIRQLSGDPVRFCEAMALILRQRHYVTGMAGSSLDVVLKSKPGAEESVRSFMTSENERDTILRQALAATGIEEERISIVPPVVVLVEVSRIIAGRNFLAYAALVDMYEQGPYSRGEPLTSLARQGGLKEVAERLQCLGAEVQLKNSEPVALGLLSQLGPVSSDYAEEAVRLAELVTLIMHQVSGAILERIYSAD